MERRVTTNGKVYRVEFRDPNLARLGGPQLLPVWTAYSPRYQAEMEAFAAMERMNASDEALEVWTPVAPLPQPELTLMERTALYAEALSAGVKVKPYET